MRCNEKLMNDFIEEVKKNNIVLTDRVISELVTYRNTQHKQIIDIINMLDSGKYNIGIISNEDRIIELIYEGVHSLEDGIINVRYRGSSTIGIISIFDIAIIPINLIN